MSGWSKIEEGSVTMVHLSTSSLVEIIVKDGSGETEETQSILLDYYQFAQLKNAIAKTDQSTQS